MKTIAFITCLLLSNILLAQEPTRKETIDWIINKLDGYSSSHEGRMEDGSRYISKLSFIVDDFGLIETRESKSLNDDKPVADMFAIVWEWIDNAEIKLPCPQSYCTPEHINIFLYNHSPQDFIRKKEAPNETFFIYMDWEHGEYNLENRLLKAFKWIGEDNRKNRPKEAF